MKIKLSPVLLDSPLVATVSGDKIILNGEQLDFTPLNELEALPQSAIDSPWLTGTVTRIDGEIHLTLRCPHGSNAPDETRFPAAFDEPMTITDGPVPLPPYDTAQQQDDGETPA